MPVEAVFIVRSLCLSVVTVAGQYGPAMLVYPLQALEEKEYAEIAGF